MGDKPTGGCRKFLISSLIVVFALSTLPAGQILAEEKKVESLQEKPSSVTVETMKNTPEVSAQAAISPEEAVVGSQEEGKAIEVAPVDPGNVTLNFRGADIRTVLAYISEVASVDIVPAPDVKGIIDLRLTNKPWKAALDIIVRNYGFAYEREGDIIRVVTLDKLKQEELTTHTFNLNYAKSKDVVAALKNVVGARGSVMYDDRTNTVLITDIPTNIYRIGQIIERLDKRTGQVLIEARVIETILGDDEKLGIDWNAKITASGAKRPTTFPFDYFDTGSKYLDKYTPLVQSGQKTIIPAATPGGDTQYLDPGTFPTGAVGSKGFPFVDYTVDSMANAFTLGTLDFSEFKAVLEMLKARTDTDTISNPRIATLNNNKATINVGELINLPKFERNSTTGKMEITGYEERNSGIVLDVTPHINDTNEIAMELYPQITQYLGTSPIAPGSDIYAPTFKTREAKTQVMVKDGQTIFIGGLISERDVDRRTKLPIIGDMFGDIPYVGLLFSHKDIVKQRVELIFFITVHIMSPDKVIQGVPLPSKAYVPVFSETQKGNTANNKKRLKKVN